MPSEVAAPPDLVGSAMARGEQLEDAIPLAPTTPPPTLVSKEDANALAFTIAHIQATSQKVLQAAQAWCDVQAKRVEALMNWYGVALKKLAQDETAKKKGRTLTLPLGSLSLRKEPDRIVQKEGEGAKLDFKRDDARSGNKWTRVKAWFDTLSASELDLVMNALPEELVTKFHYEREPLKKEISDHWKATGEVLPGWEIRWGEDRLTVDFVAKEAT